MRLGDREGVASSFGGGPHRPDQDEEEPACSRELTTGKLLLRLGPEDAGRAGSSGAQLSPRTAKPWPWPTRARGLPSGTSGTAAPKSSSSPGGEGSASGAGGAALGCHRFSPQPFSSAVYEPGGAS